jgi:alanine-glyoxylate transaminase/serine-glyoxylate transaminase/serine-pyruvate transaminase
LEQRWQRHERNHQLLKQALSELGLELASQPGHQLWQLNAVRVAEGADEALVRKRLLSEFNIEIGAGLGPMKGRIWRIGLMGETSTEKNVAHVVSALRTVLGR